MKTALITGASRGIGTACAIALAKDGFNVIINYLNSREKAQKLEQIISQNYGVSVICIKADVAQKTDVDNMISLAKEQFGTVDVLINNAGISLIKLFGDTTPEDWNNIISTNLTSVYNTSHAVLPDMIKNHDGCIVNISSMWGQVGASCEVAYSASKAGVIGFTKALAKEVAPSGIRVNCVAPGVISTDMMAQCDSETERLLKEEIPMGDFGTAKNVADAVSFLVSDKSKYTTGQVLSINGGMVV